MSSSLVGNTFFGMDLSRIQYRWMRFRRRVSKRVLLIDFDSTSVTMAEAQIQAETVSFDHVRRYQLPEDALERGVPAEPVKMAALIRGFCQEAAIPAHRAAVVLPHDVVFSAVVKLPSSVPPESALQHALDPKSALQLPIQLDQMDVDVVPLELDGDHRSYFLTAVPCKLVDRIIDTLQAADLEMVRLQIGLFAQLQHLVTTFASLGLCDGFLHLEMLRDCTQATLVGSLGPLKIVRLPAIRDFPDLPDHTPTSVANSALNAESHIINSDAYLPLSDLDLRGFCRELRQFILQCTTQHPGLQLTSIALAGVNSAHPTLPSLLKDALGLPVQVIRPLATPGVGQFTPEAPILIQSLGRLVGLGMCLLPASIASSMEEQQPHESPVLEESPQPLGAQPLEIDEAIAPAFPIEPEQPISISISEDDSPAELLQAKSPAPLFSFAPLAEPDHVPEKAEVETESPKPTGTVDELDDSDEVPFSLGDLMSSYEAKASVDPTGIDDTDPLD